MAWYGWVLIIISLAGFIFLKVKIAGAWLEKQKEKKIQRKKRMEDED